MKKALPLLLFFLTAAVAGAAEAPSSETIAAALRDKAMHGDTVAWDFVSELTTRIGPRPAP